MFDLWKKAEKKPPKEKTPLQSPSRIESQYFSFSSKKINKNFLPMIQLRTDHFENIEKKVEFIKQMIPFSDVASINF